MNKNIFFSIIVPIYNTKKEYLIECLKSLKAINYSDYEVILVNDGSNKDTEDTIKANLTDNMLLINQTNIGQYKSRMNGIGKANGEYIVFFDSDDILHKDSLNTLNDIINNNKYPDVVMYSLPRFNNSIESLFNMNHYFNEGIVDKNDVLKEIANFHICNICSKCAKKELLVNSELDNNYKYGEDLVQATDLVLKANSFYYTKKPIYYYRMNNENRDYYNLQNPADANYLVPIYNLLFKNNNNIDLLATYKTAAINNIIYRSFIICKLNKNYNNKIALLEELQIQPIVHILIKINQKAVFKSELLFNIFINKHYRLLNILANIYGLIFKYDKVTYK